MAEANPVRGPKRPRPINLTHRDGRPRSYPVRVDFRDMRKPCECGGKDCETGAMAWPMFLVGIRLRDARYKTRFHAISPIQLGLN